MVLYSDKEWILLSLPPLLRGTIQKIGLLGATASFLNTPPLQVLQTTVVGIVCFVVHDEFIIHKVETVWSGLIRVCHHLTNWKRRRARRQLRNKDTQIWWYERKGAELTEVVRKLRELVNVFACVAAVRNAKTEVKVEILQKASLKVMPLNHTEAVNGAVTHCELHSAERGKETN